MLLLLLLLLLLLFSSGAPIHFGSQSLLADCGHPIRQLMSHDVAWGGGRQIMVTVIGSAS